MENKIKNWLTIAETSKKAGNNKEAIHYYNKILEVNPEYEDAWFGKGQCSLLQAKLTDIKIDQASTYFDMAIEHSDNNAEMIHKVGTFLAQKLPLIYDFSKSHYFEFKNVGNAKSEMLYNVRLVADTFERFRIQFDYKDLNFLKGGIKIFAKVYSDTLDQKYLELKTQFINDAKEIDPNFVPPSTTGCFIATAVYGNYDNDVVIELRRYRDNTLQKSFIGQCFIKSYYKFSPPIANLIKKNYLLKKLTLWFLILPIYSFIKNK